jgi:hypothetical protein
MRSLRRIEVQYPHIIVAKMRQCREPEVRTISRRVRLRTSGSKAAPE